MKLDPSTMLEHYRRDRNKLLEFILTSPTLVKQVRTPSGSAAFSLSGINLDTLSADYVINCISSGGVVDVSEATNSYYRELAYPTMIHSQSGNSYFTLSESKLSGSPPNRQPPPVGGRKRTNVAPQSSSQAEQILDHKIASWKDDRESKAVNETIRPSKPADAGGVPLLGLPPLQTGLSDDNLRESAYEVLVASLVVSGIEVLSEQGKRRERSSKLLSGLKSRKDREIVQPQCQDRNLELLSTIRTQMEVSEAMDLCIRQRLMRGGSRTPSAQSDVLQIVLGLINSISRSSFQHEKSYINWKNRQANILEEFCCPGNLSAEGATIKYSIDKIRNAREWDTMSASERAENLVSIRNFASKLSSKAKIGDESCHSASGQHLKIRLYEKLLSSMFDILDEGQLLEETDEILKLLKLTWPTLGINKIIHEALWGWVLFKQFIQTDVEMLLEYTSVQVQKVLEDESLYEAGEGLICTSEWKGDAFQLNLVPAILLSIRIWCDRELQDYHRCFGQTPSKFTRILTFAITAGVLDLNELGELSISDTSTKSTSRRLNKYIKNSVQAAYSQVVDNLDLKCNLEGTHPLAMLANALRLIIEKEYTVFCPILHKWCPEAGMISATLLHQLFWERLRPFLQGLSSLSQDAKLVLSSAHVLDQKLSQLYSFGSEENYMHEPLHVDLDHYQIEEVSGPLILDWVMSQHAYILDWIGRAFDLEEWEPLSSQQKQAVSVVEVFRMIEETADQFFGLNLPVNITHLQALLSIIIHSLDAYLNKIIDQLVEKNILYPSVPSLTRYEETLIAISRKKTIEPKVLDEKSGHTLNQLTIPKLCIRLNTLQYIRNHISSLEDGMRKSWGQIRRSVKRKWFNIVDEETSEMSGRTMSMSDDSLDELFSTTFDGIRSSVTDAINKTIDIIGTKVVFWDLREQFLFRLYHGGVEKARMESVLPNVDSVLDQICGLVDDVVRDPLVLSIFRASLEGYLWVLLDGGPSRAFSDSDVTLMEDDLDILKDFFVAEGEGLPRSMVEREAKFARQVLSLFSLQSSTIIQMLMSASERISTGLESHSHAHRSLDNANTLIRILCHKKDREASKFLKRQYQLPPSSEYEDNPSNESTSSSSFGSGSGSAIISDLLKRSASFRFPETGHSSIKSLKKKFQDAYW